MHQPIVFIVEHLVLEHSCSEIFRTYLQLDVFMWM